MPLQETSGTASYDAFGGGVAAVPNYIEDVFSTWLYTGNGSTQTITNGIDLAGKGGLVWVKSRDVASGHFLYDTSRGVNQYLASNTTAASANYNSSLTAFNSNGFTLGFNLGNVDEKYASWTFRKQPKFFDVVTYTGNGTAGLTINHSLGSVPGCIMIKQYATNATQWVVYHRSIGGTGALCLNDTTAADYGSYYFNNTDPTATQFTLGGSGYVNQSGKQFVAYLFAHNAGGFGLTGTDNVISCGSFTTDGSGNATVNLGYEPQWLIYKRSDGVSNWGMADTMRGWSETNINRLYADSSNADSAYTANPGQSPTATGFKFSAGLLSTSATYIYIAIRRGPMKTPTSGTSVFAPVTQTSDGTVTTGFPVDLSILTGRDTTYSYDRSVIDRLRGSQLSSYNVLVTNSTAAQSSGTGNGMALDSNVSVVDNWLPPSVSAIYWNFRRAPGFFDEVCYTGTGTDNTQITHNLGVAPELIITKKRSSTGDWWTLCTADAARRVGRVNLTNAFTNSGIASIFGNGTSYVAPTASVFTLGSGSTSTNTSGATYVAYLFASCPGVSKVGSYTGNGGTQTIDCGFTGGARFVLIKRTDSTGDWYVYDTARGMTTLTDPYLLLNSTAAESATLGSVTSVTGGFALNASILAAINTNAASYIFLAIA